MNQLTAGIKIEGEHKKTVKFIKGYFNKYKKFPSDKQIFTSISKDHLREHKNYYTKLKQAKL